MHFAIKKIISLQAADRSVENLPIPSEHCPVEHRIDPLEYRFFQGYLSRAICSLQNSYSRSAIDEQFFHRLLCNDHRRIEHSQNTFDLALFLREKGMEPILFQEDQKHTRPRFRGHIYASLDRHHCQLGKTLFQFDISWMPRLSPLQ